MARLTQSQPEPIRVEVPVKSGPTFDRTAYQRDYMKRYRAKKRDEK